MNNVLGGTSGLAKADNDENLVSPSTGRSLASEVLEKARTRFDKFWGKDSKDDDV